MDPAGIVLRVLAAYVVLLTLVRVSGKRTVKHATPFDFTIALIVGDLVDDVVWSEVGIGQFLVAVLVLFTTHTAVDYLRYRSGGGWRPT
jgi:uncharacterized membrane protein YcaP (DUF421 family)